MGDRGKTLTRLPPDYDPGDATLSRSAGEGGPSPKGLVGEGAPPPRKLQSSGPFGGSARRLAVLFALCEHEGVEIVIARDAGKVLARMQSAKARDIREAIDKVVADPTAPNNNLRALRGVPNGFRIRVGDWRVSYTLNYEAGVMSVFEIAPRGGAYR
jgi:mRNA interferase RelE/StbE